MGHFWPWGVFGYVGPVLCRITDTNFREHLPSRSLGEYKVSRTPRITAEPRSNRLGGLTLPFPHSSGIRLIVPHERISSSALTSG
jgi:hypothetical protein